MLLLKKSIIFSFRNSQLIFIYILINSISFKILLAKGIASKRYVSFLTLLQSIIVLYISCGIYKAICELINGKKISFNDFRNYCAQYFIPYIKVSIGFVLLAIPFFLPYVIYILVHKNLLPVEELGKTVPAISIRLLSFMFLTSITIYVLQFLFIDNILNMKAVLQGISYFFKSFKKSLPPIIVILFLNISLIIFTLIIVQFPSSSNIYWYLTYAMGAFDSYVSIIVFIMACYLYISLRNI